MPRTELRELLKALFDRRHLRQFIGDTFGDALLTAVYWDQRLDDVAEQVVYELAQRGLTGDELYDALVEERPSRSKDIEAVRLDADTKEVREETLVLKWKPRDGGQLKPGDILRHGDDSDTPAAPFFVEFPYPNHLVGHDEALRGLHALLTRNNTTVTAALAGQGGVGKTQLAVAYAHSYRHEPCYDQGVFWFNATSTDALVSQFSAYAQQLHLSETGAGGDTQSRALRFLGWLKVRPRVLLILDDVWNPYFLSQSLPELPGSRLSSLPCRILLTSRRNDINNVEHMKIGVLSSDDARTLLLNDSGADRDATSTASVDLVCSLVGYLPLALRIAGALLRYNPMPLIDFADSLRDAGLVPTLDERESVTGESWRLNDYEHAMSVVLQRSWDAIPKRASLARLAMTVLGSMPVNRVIDVSFLAPLIAESNDPVQLTWPFLHLLKRLSLIELLKNNSALRLHPLVHEFAASKASTNDCAIAVGRGLAFWTGPYLVKSSAESWSKLGDDLVLLTGVCDSSAEVSSRLRAFIRVFSFADGFPQDEGPEALLASFHYLTVRLGMKSFARRLSDLLSQSRKRWLKTLWTTDDDDPAERAVVSTHGITSDVALARDGESILVLKERQPGMAIIHWNRLQGVQRVAIETCDESLHGRHGKKIPERIVYRSDGNRFVLLFGDYSLQMWDARNLICLHEIRPETDHLVTPGGAWSLVLSPQGRYAFVADDGGQLLVFDLEARVVCSQCIIDDIPTACAVLDETAEAFFLASHVNSSEPEKLSVWRWNEHKIEDVTQVSHAAQFLSYCTEGTSLGALLFLVREDEESEIVAFQLDQRCWLKILCGEYASRTTSAAVSADGSRMLMSDGTGSCLLLTPQTKSPEGRITDISGMVMSMFLDATGKTAATVSSHHIVKVWDLTRARKLEHGRAQLCVGMGIVDERIWIVNFEGRVLHCDAISGSLKASCPQREPIRVLNDVSVCRDGWIIGVGDESIFLFNPATMEWTPFEAFDNEDGANLSSNEDGNGDSDWSDPDAADGEGDEYEEDAHADGFESLYDRCAVGEAVVAISFSNNSLLVAHRDTGEVLRRLAADGPIGAFALSGDGTSILLDWGPTTASLWRWQIDEQVPIMLEGGDPYQQLTCVTMSPDGTVGLLGDMAGNVWLWDLTRNELLAKKSIGHYPLKNAFVAPSGNVLVVDDGDRIVLLRLVKEPGTLEHVAEVTLPDVEQAILAPSTDIIIARTFGGALVGFQLQ